jgi:hypothetical protein
MLGVPLGTGAAHVVQFRPVGVEQGVRESEQDPRSAAMEESIDLCFIHVSGPPGLPTLVAFPRVPVLFLGAKHLSFAAKVRRSCFPEEAGTWREGLVRAVTKNSEAIDSFQQALQKDRDSR